MLNDPAKLDPQKRVYPYFIGVPNLMASLATSPCRNEVISPDLQDVARPRHNITTNRLAMWYQSPSHELQYVTQRHTNIVELSDLPRVAQCRAFPPKFKPCSSATLTTATAEGPTVRLSDLCKRLPLCSVYTNLELPSSCCLQLLPPISINTSFQPINIFATSGFPPLPFTVAR